MDDRGKWRLNSRCKGKTVKTKICLLGIFAFVTLTIAAPRTWVLKTGETVTGDYVSSGTTTIVVKTGGTNCFLTISNLSDDDQAYIAEIRAAQLQARLDAEAKQMERAGWIEFTAQFLENFPEKSEDKTGWIDAEFVELDSSHSEYPERYLGFSVRDKNGDFLNRCIAEKQIVRDPDAEHFVTDPNPLIDQISKLKRGDKIRLIGRKSDLHLNDSSNAGWRFFIDKVEITKRAKE
jgi:hypothetical protein